MLDHIKFLVIEYMHLIVPMIIILGLYINNMPINFRSEKFISNIFEYITGSPNGEFNLETAKKIGIKDSKSKAYEIVSWFFSFVKSAMSPSYKTMLFKTIILVFFIGILTGVSYSLMFMICSISITIISFVFYLIFWLLTLYSTGAEEEWVNTNIDSLQLDNYETILMNLISVLVMVLIWVILHNVLNDISQTNPSMNNTIRNVIKDHPSRITFLIVLLILILYLRLDGLAYYIVDIKTYIFTYSKIWANNNIYNPLPGTKENPPGLKPLQMFYLFIYVSIFILILGINSYESWKDKLTGIAGLKLKDISIFNNLIEQTNHPRVVYSFYIYYILLQSKYGAGWISIIFFLTGIDIGIKSGGFGMSFIESELPPGGLENVEKMAQTAIASGASGMPGMPGIPGM